MLLRFRDSVCSLVKKIGINWGNPDISTSAQKANIDIKFQKNYSKFIKGNSQRKNFQISTICFQTSILRRWFQSYCLN